MILRSWLSSRVVATDKVVTPLRVWPTDVDVSNVNQSLYFFYFELSRWNVILRSPLKQAMKEAQCLPITASQTVRILKPLKRWQKVNVTTKLAYWDDKWLYIEHLIHRKEQLIALALVKGLFRGREGNVPTANLMQRMGFAF